MQLTYYPEIKKEATLPFCVTGVGINDNQLSLPSDTERLFLVTDGCARININGQTIELLKGCACWISPRAHAVIESQVNGVKFNWLTADGISSVSSSLFVSEDHAVFDTADLSASAALFRGIYEALSTDRSYGGFTASAILYQLIIKLNRDAASIPERKCKADRR